MTPLKPIGVDVEQIGIGPVIHNPIKTIQDVEKLSQIDPEQECTICIGVLQLNF